MPLHLKAKEGDVAERVIISGDSERVKQMSTMLDGARVVNENRGFLMYTGTYGPYPVTLATHGIGGPSASIVIEELIMLGAREIVRLGTAGSLKLDIEVGDIVLPSSAAFGSGGTVGEYFGDVGVAPAPDYRLLTKLNAAFAKEHVKAFVGPVYSKDGFYSASDLFGRLAKYNFLCVEMECATLFALAQLKGVAAAGALLMSDSVIKETKMLPASELRPFVDRAVKSVLEALTSGPA